MSLRSDVRRATQRGAGRLLGDACVVAACRGELAVIAEHRSGPASGAVVTTRPARSHSAPCMG